MISSKQLEKKIHHFNNADETKLSQSLFKAEIKTNF